MSPRRRRFSKLFPLLLMAALFAPGSARAAEKPEDAPPEIRYKNQIEETTEMARKLRDATSTLEADYSAFIAYLRPDLARYRELSDAQALIWDKLTAAYRAGDIEEARRLRAEIDKSERIRTIWRLRIVDLRIKQGQTAPKESNYLEESRWLPPAVNSAFDALVDAKRAASEGWGRAADAMYPGADPAAMTAAKEEAYALEAERDIAQWRADWALQRERMQTDKTISTPEITKALERIQEARLKREQLRREEAQRDRRGREIESELRASERAFREAYEAAYAEKIRPKGSRR